MELAERQRLARQALDGYGSGPDATLDATAAALAAAEAAQTVVLVEGISDQIALETLASRRGRDLAAERIVVVPIGGAQAAARHLARFGPRGADLRVVGMCDTGEEDYVWRGLAASGLGMPHSRSDMERLGFFVCVNDLEDELIRAAGRSALEPLLQSQGDLVSFRVFQKQPVWRHERFENQMHRWMRAGARRNLRYAKLIVQSVALDRMPRTLDAVLNATRSPTERIR